MQQLLEIALRAAREAGEAIVAMREGVTHEIKNDGSPVTAADIRAHDSIVKHLTQTGIMILSEESNGISIPYPEYLWVIDPIDGTKEYLHGTTDFCVMIALLHIGRPVLGVVDAPALNTVLYATKNGGAFVVRDGVTSPLHAPHTHHEPLQFLCSVNHFAPYMEIVTNILHAEKVPRGSVGVKAGLLAQGVGDFFFNQGKLGEWDICAPEIIFREAGGVVTDCTGNEIVYGNPEHRLQHGILFSQRECFGEVLTAVKATM
jgi:3'(2'), 5'-bisphosphate nucleotidase